MKRLKMYVGADIDIRCDNSADSEVDVHGAGTWNWRNQDREYTFKSCFALDIHRCPFRRPTILL
jgi:hypothetical protein